VGFSFRWLIHRHLAKKGALRVAKGSKKKGVDSSENGGNSPQTMTRKAFEKELAKLQVELTRLQAWWCPRARG
jgi:hypothetical protein